MIELKRLPRWRGPFEAAVDDIKTRPFVWFENDCGRGLVVKLVLALTGVDLSAQFPDHYKSAAGALKVMRKYGFENLADMAATMLPEVHPSAARIGDIVAIPTGSAFGYALGVVNGERCFVLMPGGIGTVDLLDATRAFKVG